VPSAGTRCDHMVAKDSLIFVLHISIWGSKLFLGGYVVTVLNFGRYDSVTQIGRYGVLLLRLCLPWKTLFYRRDRAILLLCSLLSSLFETL